MKNKILLIVMLLETTLLIGGVIYMAHDKVYGKCENLCDVEVIAKENIAVLTGAMEIESERPGSTTIDYPSGFTKDNCVPIAFGINREGYSEWGLNFYGVYEGSVDLIRVSFNRAINLNTDNISVRVINPVTSSITVNYKIVLMKVS